MIVNSSDASLLYRTAAGAPYQNLDSASCSSPFHITSADSSSTQTSGLRAIESSAAQVSSLGVRFPQAEVTAIGK